MNIFGARIDAEDWRDVRYKRSPVPVPEMIDLRYRLPAVWDQYGIGACEGMAGAALLSFLYPGYAASPLAIYYHARLFDGTTGKDAGATTRSMLKVLQKIGGTPLSSWPYQTWRVLDPPPEIIGYVLPKIALYARMTDGDECLNCLASGYPFVMSYRCPPAMESPETAAHGVLVPDAQAQLFMPAHAVLCVGATTNFFAHPDFIRSGLSRAQAEETMLLLRNSWGSHWGIDGHFWMPLSWAVDRHTGGDLWFGHRLVTHVDEQDGARVGGIKISGQFV